MRNLKRILAVPLLLTCGVLAQAQTRSVSETAITQIAAQPPTHGQGKGEAVLIAGPERRALQVLMKSVQNQITSAAGAMPADKYGFAPTDGEFKGVRTFGQQVKHLAATNHILAAAALGEEPPIDAGDEMGPDAVRTRSRAPRSRLCSGSEATRLALTVEALIHAFDHYGQMAVYLRLNGVVPPASMP